VEELDPSQMKEETINSLCTRAVGAPATFERCPHESGSRSVRASMTGVAQIIQAYSSEKNKW
jgi:hypothetical protein